MRTGRIEVVAGAVVAGAVVAGPVVAGAIPPNPVITAPSLAGALAVVAGPSIAGAVVAARLIPVRRLGVFAVRQRARLWATRRGGTRLRLPM
jgi:hypothetical protein